MDEKERSAQTTADAEHAEADVGLADTDKAQETATNTETFSDGEEKEEKPAEKQPQTKEQNSEFARRRRDAELKAKLKAERENAIIEALGGKNPFTGEDMKDSADVEEYMAQKEIEKEGGDPVADYARHLKDRERKRAEEKAEKERKEEWFRLDRDEFAQKHPDVNMASLFEDEGFLSFAEGKIGHRSLSYIYEGYANMKSDFEKAASRKAAQIYANSAASPGALGSAAAPDQNFLTEEEVRKHKADSAWIKSNYEKIQNSMKKWGK